MASGEMSMIDSLHSFSSREKVRELHGTWFKGIGKYSITTGVMTCEINGVKTVAMALVTSERLRGMDVKAIHFHHDPCIDVLEAAKNRVQKHNGMILIRGQVAHDYRVA